MYVRLTMLAMSTKIKITCCFLFNNATELVVRSAISAGAHKNVYRTDDGCVFFFGIKKADCIG